VWTKYFCPRLGEHFLLFESVGLSVVSSSNDAHRSSLRPLSHTVRNPTTRLHTH